MGKPAERAIEHRLTVLGPPGKLKTFQSEQKDWTAKLQARHLELFRASASSGTCVWWFDSGRVILEELSELSAKRPELIFLLQWEDELERSFGMAKAKQGKLQLAQFAC